MLVEVEKLVAIEEQLTGVRETMTLYVVGQLRPFVFLRFTQQNELESGVDLIARGFRVGCNAGCYVFTLANEESIIQHRKGLQRGGGNIAHRREGTAIRAIERIHQRIRNGAKQKAVDRTPTGRRGVGIEVFVVEKSRIPSWHKGRIATVDELHHGGASHGEIEAIA